MTFRSLPIIAQDLYAGNTKYIRAGCQNWTGTDGVSEVYGGEKLVKRFIKIDKLKTAMGSQDDLPRAYRFGYGVLDTNLNSRQDPGEKKVYFEFSDYSIPYIFYENPA